MFWDMSTVSLASLACLDSKFPGPLEKCGGKRKLPYGLQAWRVCISSSVFHAQAMVVTSCGKGESPT